MLKTNLSYSPNSKRPLGGLKSHRLSRPRSFHSLIPAEGGGHTGRKLKVEVGGGRVQGHAGNSGGGGGSGTIPGPGGLN